LTPLDIFFWGYVNIYMDKIQGLDHLKARIREAAAEQVTRDMLHRMYGNK
jgi:hypothetical protein